MIITSAQIRAARVLVGADQIDIAKAAGISRQSLVNIEAKGVNEVKSREITLAKILAALGERGAMLVPNGVVRVLQANPSLVQNKILAECAQQGLADKGAR
jgi:DNA-binding XRE family transcriptional regulator